MAAPDAAPPVRQRKPFSAERWDASYTQHTASALRRRALAAQNGAAAA